MSEAAQASAEPVGVAIVGAREGSIFTECLIANLRRYHYRGAIWPVNPNHTAISGLTSFATLAQVPGRPEISVIALAADNCTEAALDAIASGSDSVVVYSNGFAELGTPAGIDRQLRLVERIGDARGRLFGPQSLGLADFRQGVCALTCPIPSRLRAGRISIVSQSGALTSSILDAMAEEGLGIDWCASIGNGAGIDAVEAVGRAAARRGTSVICAYLEGLGDAAAIARFRGVANSLARSRKHLVVVKAGFSQTAARIATSHTASMTGNDILVDALLDSPNVWRVADIDEMARLAGVLLTLNSAGRTPRRIIGRGIAVIEGSGGAGALAADAAARVGAPLARFEEVTQEALQQVGGPGSYIHNPIDLTAALASESSRQGVAEAYRAVLCDPNVFAVVVPSSVALPDGSARRSYHRMALQRYVDLAKELNVPVFISTVSSGVWTPWARRWQSRLPAQVKLQRGVTRTLAALALVVGRASRIRAIGNDTALTATEATSGLVDEGAARLVLARCGLPLVPGCLAPTPSAAGSAIALLRPPFAVKIAAAELAHKARVGGVILGCTDVRSVRRAIRSVIASAIAEGVPVDKIAGALVQEMSFGTEVFVGLSRDDDLGSYLVLGRGGRGTSSSDRFTALLPIKIGDLRRMIRGLDPSSSRRPRPWRQLSDMVEFAASSFMSGALRTYQTVEFNPVIVSDSGPLIADALMVHGAELA